MNENFSQREMEEKKLMQKDPDLMNVLLAKERTIEAKLRTTLSVINTGAAIAALGFALIKFFAENQGAFITGMFLLFCALAIAAYGIRRFVHYAQESRMIKRHRADLAQLIE